ncbi:YqiA/YcfP family alpha/beta fold hydrolase [Halomonas koreensis]|uniref:YqiA/YcfP family alpha/beta fold hydrolase n=1 Tax=Halomonas koreensis TaxID=245385 RepID=A0ABU1G5C8_9GAMM|nr:YqiA/YcfP family alpha/beta fold hydrolase [Halomonas koreensis]MDR5868151.1 YqiA/YcfP family alpha/beta fold hydrolase [Halomonas koreensis]
MSDPHNRIKTLYVFLSHGLESGPHSTKVQALKTLVDEQDAMIPVVLDYRGMASPSQRLDHLLSVIDERGARPEETILVGSSMGGWLSAAVSQRTPVLGCFLMAPALGLAHYPDPAPRIGARHAFIIHGWRDEVVPPGPVMQQACDQRLPLQVMDDGHRLQHSLEALTHEFERFLMLCRSSP